MALELARLPEEDLPLVIEFVDYLKQQRQTTPRPRLSLAEMRAEARRRAKLEWVDIPAEAVRSVIADDPDDDHILVCAVVGKADYLVSYDPHFDCLEEEHQGGRITKALPFLWAVRGDHPPKTTEAGNG